MQGRSTPFLADTRKEGATYMQEFLRRLFSCGRSSPIGANFHGWIAFNRAFARVGKVVRRGLFRPTCAIRSILRCLRVHSVSGGDYAVDPGGRHVSEIV